METHNIQIGGRQKVNPDEVVMLQADINYSIFFCRWNKINSSHYFKIARISLYTIRFLSYPQIVFGQSQMCVSFFGRHKYNTND